MRVRSATSSSSITDLVQCEKEVNVYNFIIDENHTYFVGQERLLSWDVTIFNDVYMLCPGLPRTIAGQDGITFIGLHKTNASHH